MSSKIIYLVLPIILISLGCSTTKKVEVSTESVAISKDGKILAKLQTYWQDTYITATSNSPIPPGEKENAIGKSLARDAAITKCYADLYRQIGDVQLTETITVLNAVVNSHTKTEMQGTIRGAKIIEDRWDDENKLYKISMELKQTELIKYVKEWIDDGRINPEDLERALLK